MLNVAPTAKEPTGFKINFTPGVKWSGFAGTVGTETGTMSELTCDICGGEIEDDGAHHDVIVHEACHESEYKMRQMP